MFVANIFGQVPQRISYQAVIRNDKNELLVKKTISIRISIEKENANKSTRIYYGETQTATTNENGLVSIEIGAGTLQTGSIYASLSEVNWSDGPYLIRTNIDPTGGATYTISGSSPILMVPYALHAQTAEMAKNVTEADPVFNASVAKGITKNDTTKWNKKQDKLTAGQGISITGNVISFNGAVADTSTQEYFVETDPIFSQSVAKGITGSDTARWNKKLSVETDPIFSASIAKGITANDTAKWNNKLSTETDPVFNASIAKGITANDTSNWNNKLSTEADPLFHANVGDSIRKYINPLLAQIQSMQTTIEGLQLQTGALVKDIDGNIYKTVTIGMQTWIAENLKVTRFNDGTLIQYMPGDSSGWIDDNRENAPPMYCYYNNSVDTAKKYGILYNWFVAGSSKNVCPAGYHVPSFDEWCVLRKCLKNNGYAYDGDKSSSSVAKSLAMPGLWKSSGVAGSIGNTDYPQKINASGFSALPGGVRVPPGYTSGGVPILTYSYFREQALWWTSSTTYYYGKTGNYASLIYYSGSFTICPYGINTTSGCNIRCVKD